GAARQPAAGRPPRARRPFARRRALRLRRRPLAAVERAGGRRDAAPRRPAGTGAPAPGPPRLSSSLRARRRRHGRPPRAAGAGLPLPPPAEPGLERPAVADGRPRLRPRRLPPALGGLAARQLGGAPAAPPLRPRSLR